MEKYKPYERYKDSGVEWIGEIPEHWKIGRFKHSVEGCIGGVWGEEPGDDENDIVCVRVADFDRVKLTVNEENLTFRSIPLSQKKRRELNEGDLLIEKSGGGDQQPVGTVVINTIKLPAVCSNFIGRMPVSNRYSPYFLSYLHSAVYSIRLNVKSIKQTTGIQNLDIASYLNEKVAFPPLKEQQAIANFLGYKTTEIDNLIVDKEKLITLLQEYRQAVISEAVTKGLDPNVKMKDSGIEWIGEIPEHWEVKPNISLFSERVQRKGDLHLDLLAVTQSRGIILQEEITDRKDISSLDKSNYKIVRRNDLAYNKMRMWQGAVGWSSYDGIVSPAYVVLKPVNSVNSKYFYYLFKSPQLIHAFKLYSYGICDDQNSLRYQDFKRIYSCVPPLIEQQAIVDYLDQKTSEIDSLISGIQDSIEQLKAYRQSLISEAVTGKIDVRGFAAEGGVASGQDA